MELLGPFSGPFDPFLEHFGPLFGPKNDKKTPLARQMKLYRVMDGHRPQGRTLEGPWNICRAFGGILGALWGLFNPILTPFWTVLVYFFKGQNKRAGAREPGLEDQGKMAGQEIRGEMGEGNGEREWERVPEGMGEGAREGGKWSHLGGPTRNFFK